MSSLAPAHSPLLAFPSRDAPKSQPFPVRHDSNSSADKSQPTSARATPSPLGSDSEESEGDQSTPSSPNQEHSTKDESETADGDEQEDSMEPTPLPSRLTRPKGLQERKQLSASGLNGGRKNTTLAANLGRRRSDSLKWSKYATMAPVSIELNLSNDELSRKD